MTLTKEALYQENLPKIIKTATWEYLADEDCLQALTKNKDYEILIYLEGWNGHKQRYTIYLNTEEEEIDNLQIEDGDPLFEAVHELYEEIEAEAELANIQEVFDAFLAD